MKEFASLLKPLFCNTPSYTQECEDSHDDGIDNHWYQESLVCDNKVGHGGKIWTKTAANAVTCAV